MRIHLLHSAFSLVLLLSLPLTAQTVSGTVVEADSQTALVYVNVGVAGHNVGGITDEAGRFSLALSGVDELDSLRFSLLGYEPLAIAVSDLERDGNLIRLTPRSYDLSIATVAASRRVDYRELGCYRPGKTTTGQSGTGDFGYGGEMGIRVDFSGDPLLVEEIGFHTRFNSVDSALFRLNVYAVGEDGNPGISLLTREQYVTSYAGDNKIAKNLSGEGLAVNRDVIITLEFIRIWYADKGGNHLFYTHCRPRETPAGTYYRASSFANWERGGHPLALYLRGTPVEE